MAEHHEGQPFSFLESTTPHQLMSPILQSIIPRVLDEDNSVSMPYELTQRQLVTGVWMTRVTGTISLLSSLCMIYMAWNRRQGLFHRLILGTSLL